MHVQPDSEFLILPGETMINWFKKLDSIVIIMIFTIIIGVIVITLRSRTYYIGYEIANLKNQEKTLREENGELLIERANVQRNLRNTLLNEKDSSGKSKFVFPEPSHVLTDEGK